MLKRSLDIVISLIALILLSPFLFIISQKIAADFGKPVIFKQKRPGFRGELFDMLKFRTMVDSVNKDGELLPDSKRLTTLGLKLRNTSIDELPGLWNVLKGEMSLVGPRPLLVEYLPLYSDEQKRRHEVKPGITGWAQINGRNAISWNEKFTLDVWYVDNQSLLLDLKILFMTVQKVLHKADINEQGEATMSKFSGNH